LGKLIDKRQKGKKKLEKLIRNGRRRRGEKRSVVK